ncbi:hypothetical protein [Phocaeicola plebeius]|uniref:hypothetical protein n=1 Tax=Phocaeicola plebeius TaxID=310297 RepID=UPI0026F205B3|nr:hypothetical protein [Phocaeicola plebeius]
MMNFQTFKEHIASLKVVYSVRDRVPYKVCSVQGNLLTIQRESTGNYVEIKLDELYNFYSNETIYTTKAAREYISGYVYSPAVAVIKELVK